MNQLADGLIQYLMLIALLTFHEYGHAWMAWKCGDDTARLQGRMSLNPIVHIDPIGTVLMPMLQLFLPYGAGQFLIGGAKPVPVNPYNLRRPSRDDILVTLAGPAMNFILALIILAVARLAVFTGCVEAVTLLLLLAHLSLMLCFFNLLLPIPPLDGSQILRALVGMSHETYAKLAQFSFIPVMIVWQIPVVRAAVNDTTQWFFVFFARGVGFH